MSLVQEIDKLLPQTQCGECDFAGCLPYAEALAQRRAPINKCPPGGIATVKALGALLHIDPTPYLAKSILNTRAPAQALIREEECIGCTKCIKACPVDAIIGSGKFMHTVIADECTGCGLCIAPCPVDCIELITQEVPTYDKARARARFNSKKARLAQAEYAKQQHYREKKNLAINHAQQAQAIQAKQDYIQQARARVKAKKDHESKSV